MNVLITGASRGIGKSISKIFTDNGHQVYAPTRSELDLTKRPVLKETNFDIIINNAGINPLTSIDEITDNEVMQVNYLSPLEIIQQCLPYMVEQKYGRIINIGSIWIEIAKSKRLAYSASKSALHSLTKALTVEYSHVNILANTVSPGFIGTSLTFKNNSDEEINNLIKRVPIGRLGTSDEVADIAYYLTVNNNFITGQNIIIDGGFSCTTN